VRDTEAPPLCRNDRLGARYVARFPSRTEMEATVVIPTFNRRLSLLRCLSRIPPGVPVVVVDDGSDDGTGGAVQGLDRPDLTYVGQENAGPAAARNAGLNRVETDVVAFTDDDCVPGDGWPAILVRHLEQASDRVAGVGGRVLPYKDGWISRYSTFHRILEPPQSRAYLVTANCCYRTKAVAEVGGFDPRLRHPGGEDTGLSRALRRRGYTFEFEPRAVVFHEYRESVTDFARIFFRYGEGCSRDLGA
jgi:glycosyltransferase involved in cell wall biosynthesis